MFVLTIAATPALAFAPTLSVTPVGNNMVTITVYGDANSSVQLYYSPYSSLNYNYSGATLAGTIGTTNFSGYFSTTLSVGSYNIPTNASVFVLVNNQQSTTVNWPSVGNGYTNCPTTYAYNSINTYSGCTYPPITPPTQSGSISVGVNQTSTAYGQGVGPYIVTTNSNPSVVSATASGNVITFRGNQVGSSNVVVCPSYGYGYPYGGYNYNYSNTASCSNFLVTVTPTLSFSPSTAALYGVGTSQSVSILDGYGYSYNNYPYYNNYYSNYFVTSNTNPSVVSASVSGNTLNMYAVGYGGSTITVCSNTGACGSIYVSVNTPTGYYYSNYYPQQYYY